MTNTFHAHCIQVLDKYKVSADETQVLNQLFIEIWQELQPIHQHNPRKYYGGSYAKGTMIKGSYDLDIVIYFAKNNPHSVKQLAEFVEAILSKKHRITRMGVASQFTYKEHEVDVVVGKAQDEQFVFADLWNSKEQKVIRTSLVTHINNVAEVEQVIKLMKIWRQNNSLEWHKLAVEQTIVRVLKDKPKNNLGACLQEVFLDVKTNIDNVKFLDPANCNNPIFVSDYERKRIKEAATLAFDRIQKSDYKSVIS